jgi:hypothetical protein
VNAWSVFAGWRGMGTLFFLINIFILLESSFFAERPALQRILGDVEFNLRRFLSWRAAADVQAELKGLSTCFARLSVGMTIGFIAARYCGAPRMADDFGAALILFSFAWASFRWTFNHREAVAPMRNGFLYALSIPWLVWGLDVAAGADAVGEFSTLLPWPWARSLPPVAVVAAVSGVIVTIAGLTYAIYWILFFPFPYAVLKLLMASQFLSTHVLRRFGGRILPLFILFLGFVKEAYELLKG